MALRRLAEVRREIAGSRRAAATYFVVVLAGLALARTWASGNAVAYAGVFIYALPVPFTWPLLDAAFTRYSRQPVVSAHARSRLHWVVCVLVGIVVSIPAADLRLPDQRRGSEVVPERWPSQASRPVSGGRGRCHRVSSRRLCQRRRRRSDSSSPSARAGTPLQPPTTAVPSSRHTVVRPARGT
jgi:hypothetical protein